MTRSASPFPGWLTLLLLGVWAVGAVGCDSGQSKRESQAQRLTGEWEAICVRTSTSGCLDVGTLTFRVAEGTGTKSYRLRRVGASGENEIQGTIEIGNGNTVGMVNELGSFLWGVNFDKPTTISGDIRLTLRQAREESARALLEFLGLSSGREGEGLQMDLRRSS